MRLQVIEQGQERLQFVLRTHFALYAFFGLLFVGLGLACLWLLGAELAGVLLGLVCICAGAVILAAIQRVDLKADRGSGTLEIIRRIALWPVTQRTALRLGEIGGVHILRRTLDTGRHSTASYAVRLQTPHGAVPLTFLPMFTERDARALAALIEGWLAGG